MMLQIKFGCNRPAGLGDIHVWKCGRTHGQTDARTPARVPSYKLTFWAFGSGELKMSICNAFIFTAAYLPKHNTVLWKENCWGDIRMFLRRLGIGRTRRWVLRLNRNLFCPSVKHKTSGNVRQPFIHFRIKRESNLKPDSQLYIRNPFYPGARVIDSLSFWWNANNLDSHS